MRYLWFCFLVCFTSCTGKPPEDTWRPELACPGDPSGVCDGVEDAVLHAGVARVSVTPDCFETYEDLDNNDEKGGGEPYLDCGCDRLCPEDEGYPGPDEGEGDGQFQAIWLAGFQGARAAKGVRGPDQGLLGEDDGLKATAAAFEQGQTRLAIVSIDGFGWMHDEVLAIREQLKTEGVDVDHVMVHSTHSHATPDTLGIYGRSLTSSGFNEQYAAQVRTAVVEAVKTAFGTLQPVSMKTGKIDLSTTSEKGLANYLSDTRDPFIIDPWLYAAHFAHAETGEPVLNLVNWANHPEATSDSESLMTADFVHGIRTAVEEGYEWDATSHSGLGGLVVYLNGAVGGMMTPLRIENEDPDGVLRKPHSFAKADAIGLQVGHYAVQAVNTGETVASPDLSFRKQSLYLPIDNQGFQAMYLIGVLDRSAYNFDPEASLDATNIPEVLTEVNYIQLGPVQMLTFPGEVLPELTIGGYDGSMVNAEGFSIIKEDNPNPPDLSAAPAGPYWKDLLKTEYPWVVELANDEIGYIIPPYNYILHPSAPYIFEADGDHYEETNSLGSRTAPLIDEVVQQMMSWSPE